MSAGKLINVLLGTGLAVFWQAAPGEVMTDGSLGGGTQSLMPEGTPGVYDIPSSAGQISGGNIFYSFSQFNIAAEQTARFSHSGDAYLINNVFARITGGGQSRIDGTLENSIGKSAFFLINPAGVVFGPHAAVVSDGDFYVTTADHIEFSDATQFNVSDKLPALTVAEPAAFGFTSDNPAAVRIEGSHLSLLQDRTFGIVAGDISLQSAADTLDQKELPGITIDEGQINLISSRGNVSFTLSGQALTPADSAAPTLGDIVIRDGFALDTSGGGSGKVVIRGGTLSMKQGYIRADTGRRSTVENNIAVDINTTSDIQLSNSVIAAVTGSSATGKAPDIALVTGELALNDSTISTAVSVFNRNREALPGNIQVTAETISLSNYSGVTTAPLIRDLKSATVPANFIKSGDIDIRTNTMSVESGSLINTSVISGQNASGDISITANSLNISGFAESADYFGEDRTGISTSNTLSGRITIDTDRLTMNHNAVIDAAIFGDGETEQINIIAGNFSLLNGSTISNIYKPTPLPSSRINIDVAGKLLISGASINPDSETKLRQVSGIISNGTASNGAINIKAGELILQDGGMVQSNTSFGNYASNINITAGKLDVSGYNRAIMADLMSQDAGFTDALNNARSGVVASSDSNFPGELNRSSSGHIRIQADTVALTDHALLSAQSTDNATQANHIAGSIGIQSGQLLLDRADILANNSQFDGGNININNKGGTYISNSHLNASVEGKSGNGGNIDIQAATLLLNNSRLVASAIEGNGGNITLTTGVLLALQNNTFDASSRFASSGTTSINADQEIFSQLESLPENAPTLEIFQRSLCESWAGQSTFVIGFEVIGFEVMGFKLRSAAFGENYSDRLSSLTPARQSICHSQHH